MSLLEKMIQEEEANMTAKEKHLKSIGNAVNNVLSVPILNNVLRPFQNFL